MQPSDATKATIAEIFNRASATYGQVGPGYFTYFGERLITLAGLAPGMRVLDIACGRGAVLFPAAQAVGESGSVLGIDLSEGMILATTAEILRRGIYNVTVQIMDAEHLELHDASFDAVTCGFGIFFLPRRDAALRQFRRMLRPDGLLAVSAWAPDLPPGEKARWSWVDDLMKSALPSSPDAPGPHPMSVVRTLDTPEETATRFTGAGFTQVAVHSETATFPYASPKEWWQERWSLFFRSALETLSPEALAELHRRALAHAEQMQAQGQLITELQVLYTIAR